MTQLRTNAVVLGMLLAAAGAVNACFLSVPEGDSVDSVGETLTGEVSLFSNKAPAVAADSDTNAVELGVRFRSDVSGTINGLKFYKGAGNGGTHLGHLWSNTGALLATVTFSGESATGWQTARFSAPVPIQAGVTYVASYHTDVGHYSATRNAFGATGADAAPLHALKDGEDGRNGVYHYGAATAFPTDTYQATNYFVDVVFQPAAAGGTCQKAAIAKVTGSPDDGNVVGNVVDGNLNTRFSSLGKGAFVQADLGGNKTACSVSVAWYRGDMRKSNYRIQVSTDGKTFTQVAAGQSSGTMNTLETYTFAPVSANYVRVVVDGNTENDWASISEIEVGAGTSEAPPPPTNPPPPPPTNPPPPPAGTCDLTATTANFTAQWNAAQGGQAICLATGNYGTFSGAVKSGIVTLRPQSGATPTMDIDFNGASNIRIEGLSLGETRMVNATKNITVTGVKFTGHVILDGLANSNILFDGNQHDGINTCATCDPALIHLPYSTATHSGVTIQNSVFANSNSDGIQTGNGVNIVNNEFHHLHETGPSDPAHTDSIQIIGGTGTLVKGNYIHDNADGIVAYDGVDHVTIEDNVIDLKTGRWGIELYSDNGSIVRHNTLRNATTCEYSPCGHIILDHKSADPAGKGTVITDNIATFVELNSGSTAAKIANNMLPSNPGTGNFQGAPTYSGGAAPSTYAGFKLAAGSAGIGKATDGTNVGIR